jgi:hypothetical protein
VRAIGRASEKSGILGAVLASKDLTTHPASGIDKR